jgi:cell division protein FtsB
VTARRIVLLVLVLAGVFALAAGEYGTWDWLTLERRVRAERAEIERLRLEVDSLRQEAHAIETDPEVQERLARELYGMIRDGEFSYNIIRPDTPRR